jgi:hypothetical protein
LSTETADRTAEQSNWIAKRDSLKRKSLIIGFTSTLLTMVAIGLLVYANTQVRPDLDGEFVVTQDSVNLYISWFSVAAGVLGLAGVMALVESLNYRSKLKKLGDFPGQRAQPKLTGKLRTASISLVIVDVFVIATLIAVALPVW